MYLHTVLKDVRARRDVGRSAEHFPPALASSAFKHVNGRFAVA